MSDSIAIPAIIVALSLQILLSFLCSSQIITENEHYSHSSAAVSRLQDEVIQLDNQYSQLTSLTNITKNIRSADMQTLSNNIDLTTPNN